MTVEHRIGSPFTVKVVGLTFTQGYPQNLHQLDYWYKERATEHGQSLDEPITAVLIRTPDNPHDANAIEVHVPSLKEPMIGHLPRSVAERMAHELDAGVHWLAGVNQVLIHPDHPENPGVSLHLERGAMIDPLFDLAKPLEALRLELESKSPMAQASVCSRSMARSPSSTPSRTTTMARNVENR